MRTIRKIRSRAAMASAAVPAAALVLAGCGGSSASADDEDPIVIGIASGLTGWLSIYDGPVKNAIEYAVEEINADGGINGRPVEIVTADNKSDVNLAASAALEVLDDGADVVVTTCDYNFGSPAAQEAQKAGKLALSCAGSALFGSVGIGPLAYSVNESSATGAAVAAEFAFDQGWRTAYLLEDTAIDFSTSWCAAFDEAFTELGGEIVGRDVFVQGDSTVQPQVSSLAALPEQPDTVAVCSLPPTGGVAIGQIRAAGLEQPIVTTSGFDGPGWLEAAPRADDVFVAASASIFGDDPNPEVNELVDAYTEAYEEPQSSYFAFGIQIAQTIFTAIEDTGSAEGADLAAELDTWTDKELLLGKTTYTPECHSAVGRPMRILEYGGGTGKYLETVTPSVQVIPEGCTE